MKQPTNFYTRQVSRFIIAWIIIVWFVVWLMGCGSNETTATEVSTLTAAPTTTEITPVSLTATPEPTSHVTLIPIVTNQTTDPQDVPPTRYTYEIVATFPHDAGAFTQGLLFDEEILYEGTGLYGESSLRRVDLASGVVLQQILLSPEYFGEGIAIVGDRIFQLTWREQIGFIYDKETFERIGEFNYTTEGWGLTYDGTHLIMSDGTDRLFFLDPATVTVVNQRQVSMVDPTDEIRKPVVRLNELEYINGEIFANIWQTDLIVRISPETGNVTGLIDLTGLLSAEDRTLATDVLNGIAYLPTTDQLFVTGKKWPKLFEIRLIEQ